MAWTCKFSFSTSGVECVVMFDPQAQSWTGTVWTIAGIKEQGSLRETIICLRNFLSALKPLSRISNWLFWRNPSSRIQQLPIDLLHDYGTESQPNCSKEAQCNYPPWTTFRNREKPFWQGHSVARWLHHYRSTIVCIVLAWMLLSSLFCTG